MGDIKMNGVNVKRREKTVQLSDERLTQFKETFTVFDRDGDGLLMLEELRQTIYTLDKAWSLSDIKRKLPKYASVDFPEFLALMADDLMEDDESESETIRGMFDFYDKNDRGFITYKQLRQAMKLGEELDEDEIDDIITNVDPKKTGKILFQQFCAYIM